MQLAPCFEHYSAEPREEADMFRKGMFHSLRT